MKRRLPLLLPVLFFLPVFLSAQESRVLKPGTVTKGETSQAMDQAIVRTLEKVNALLDDLSNPKGHKGAFAENINATLVHLR
ncbi:MAG: hypothetical protein HY400_06835, partial [Elusimicrobia bacterium]|nr:hypothetical protein [Elusimicrobiota bacterium]